MSIASLPVELLDMVFAAVIQTADENELCNIARVCRGWTGSARRLLYTSPSLETHDALVGWLESKARRDHSPRHVYVNDNAFVRLTSAHLGQLYEAFESTESLRIHSESTTFHDVHPALSIWLKYSDFPG